MRVGSAVLQAPEGTTSPRGCRSTLQRSREPAAPGPTRAFSSVGESARLITVRSVVRIHKGPRSDPLGDVAQLEEPVLCKQGVAGSSPAISTGNDPSALSPAAVAGFLYVDTRIASLREHWTVSVVQRSS